MRRRRQCLHCARRFTTYERLAPPEIRVVKRDGDSEPFDREKLLRVVRRLTKDRPLTAAAGEELVRKLEADLVDAGVQTLFTAEVAGRLLAALQAIDPLVAGRLASNYKAEDGALRDVLPPQTPSPAPPQQEGESPQLDLPIDGPRKGHR